MTQPIATPLVSSDSPSLPPSLSASDHLANVSADVVAFAKENNLTRYLPDLVELMSRVSGGPVTLRLAWDPEIPNDGAIVFESNAVGHPEDGWLSAYREWQEGVSRICAHDDTRFFTFMMV